MSTFVTPADAADAPAFPPGIRGWDHMPYGYRRWNGTVWCDTWVDDYNRQLDRIRRRFEDGFHVDDHVESWYRSLTYYDLLAKEFTATERDGE